MMNLAPATAIYVLFVVYAAFQANKVVYIMNTYIRQQGLDRQRQIIYSGIKHIANSNYT